MRRFTFSRLSRRFRSGRPVELVMGLPVLIIVSAFEITILIILKNVSENITNPWLKVLVTICWAMDLMALAITIPGWWQILKLFRLTSKRPSKQGHTREDLSGASKPYYRSFNGWVAEERLALAQEFIQLRDELDKSTGHLSSVTRISQDPAYRSVVAKGWPIIAYLLGELTVQVGGHWFMALAEITGIDAASGRTTMDAAAEAWVQWGINQGIWPQEADAVSSNMLLSREEEIFDIPPAVGSAPGT